MIMFQGNFKTSAYLFLFLISASFENVIQLGKNEDNFSQKTITDNFGNNENEESNKSTENTQVNETKPAAPKKGGMKLSSKKKDENRYY